MHNQSIYAVYLAGNIVPVKVRALIDFAVSDITYTKKNKLKSKLFVQEIEC
ncbi:MAG: hypothetical protein ACJAYB_001909 [Psychromonas sp.]|jgi:hypothetical protein